MQESFEDDWRAMGLQFVGDSTRYFLADDLLPFAELRAMLVRAA